jgi:lysophospholipase L1-like esterase
VIGAGVRDPRFALPAMLLTELRKLPALADRRVEVINAGVVGYDISQEYLYLLTHLVEYEPDLVVAYHGWNDFSVSTAYNLAAPGNGPFQAREYAGLSARLNQSFSGLGNLILFAGSFVAGILDFWPQLGIAHLARSLGHHAKAFNLDIRPQMSEEELKAVSFNPRAVLHFETMMRAMISLAKTRGFGLGLMLQPHGLNSPKPRSDYEQKYLDGVIALPQGKADQNQARDFYQALKPRIERMRHEVAGDTSICIADVSDAFADVRDTVYVDTGHLNERGEAIVAARLVAELTKCRTLARPGQ